MRDALRAEVGERIPKDARVSVNMKPSALERFLDGEPRRNRFEQAEAESMTTGRPSDELLREQLGDGYDRRVQFEEKAGNGRHFHYGALNIGGSGTPRFGRYCVIDGRPVEVTRPDPIWIAEDSITGSRFRAADGGLDWNVLAAWVAACDLMAELVLVKLESEPGSHLFLEQRVCREEDYIEALSLTPIQLDSVEEVRLESAADDDVQDRALNALLAGASPAEPLELSRHERIRAKTEARGIRWRVIP